MNVELKEMRLRNFKGVIDQTFRFSHNTIVKGTNGTGKTTINDGFTFVLFGKDSNGKTDFGYKRRDNNCKVVHDLEYSGELVFDIDGVEKRFERVVVEKWTKPRMAKEKVLSGNESIYYIDRVRCATKKEYDLEVAKIANEDVMRMMKDVNYFISQKDDIKKSMLIKLAYGVSDISQADEEIVKEVLLANEDLADFIAELGGVHVKDYNIKIATKIRAIKEEIEQIPTKIAAKKETMPQEEDWDSLEAVINENKNVLNNINEQISNDNARNAGATARINQIKSNISNKEYQLLQRENEIRSQVTNEEFTTKQKVQNIDIEISRLTTSRNLDQQRLSSDTSRSKILENQLKEKRNQFELIRSGNFVFNEEEKKCPTCGRDYDSDLLQSQKLQENKSQGLALRGEYDALNQEITLLTQQIDAGNRQINDLIRQKAEIAYQPKDVNSLIAKDLICLEIKEEIAKLKEQLEVSNTTTQGYANGLIDEKKALEAKIQDLTKKLGQREIIATTIKQIDELSIKQNALNEELASLEQKQEKAIEYQKAKDRQLLMRVNSLFSIVSWDFISEQYNGNDKIACNCYVEGMPYQERNRAGQINAGLDIINAISRAENVHLPIFIDNAESVVNYLATDSQKILLKVDENCSVLTFENK